MPLYNRAETLEQTIASLQNQTYPHWELIIVDDDSSDNSVELVKELMKNDPRIRLIESRINQGPGLTRNAGIFANNNRYIAFLDSDDLWAPEKLETQLSFMQSENSAFTYTQYRIIDEANQTSGLIKPKRKAKGRELLANNFVVTSSVMLDTEEFDMIQFPDMSSGEDLGLWLLLLTQTDSARVVPQELTYLRKWSGSISSDKVQAAKNRWHMIRNRERTPLIQSLYYFAKYATLTGFKYAVSFRDQKKSNACEQWFEELPTLKINESN